ncbi:MAG: WD40/YVTN/BNR-like repeat-containing protein, partial [Betaproteobacteria bacterium]
MKTVNGLIAAAITALAGCSTMPAPEYAVSNPIVQNSLSGMSCPEQPTIESVSASLQITAANLEAVLKNRAVSLKDFCAASADRKMRHLTKGVVARTGEYPGGADQYFRLLRMGGNVEGHQKRYSEAAKQAFEEREAALAELSTQPGFNRKGAAVWDNLGPGNVGGRIRSILVDPTNPNIVWLGAVTGGVWKSLDGGNSWRSTTDALGYVGIFSLTMMPGNPNTIFATTGEYAYSSGPGMIVTRDGGNSWSLIKPTGAAGEALTMARNLVIHPTQTNLMLVSAAYKGIWGSSDGGVTWQNISLTSGVQPSVTRLRQDPNNANNLIANTDYRGILVSGDFGLTWRYANGFPGTDQTDFRDIELAYSKSAPGRIYASITAKNGDTNRRYEIWRSDNGGKDWIYLSRAATSNWGATSRNQGSYNHVLWVNPTNANHILLGEIIVLQSLDGGNTWATVSDYATRPVSSVNSPFPEPAYANGGLNVWLHADHHVILTDPNFNGSTNRRVWFGNDGGIWRADDVTQLRVDPVSFTDYGTRAG